MKNQNNHCCDHPCHNPKDHEMCVDHVGLSFQDEYDRFVAGVHDALTSGVVLDEATIATLRLGLHVVEHYKHDVQELELYQEKFTPKKPLDLEMSNLKKCHIGRCRCGQLLVESRDRCCPKCNQFIDWTCKDC